MSLLKNKATKTVTNKVVGKRAISTIAAASMVKQSNQEVRKKEQKNNSFFNLNEYLTKEVMKKSLTSFSKDFFYWSRTLKK